MVKGQGHHQFVCLLLFKSLYYRKKTEQRDILRSTENVKKLEASIVFISFLCFFTVCVIVALLNGSKWLVQLYFPLCFFPLA